MAFPFWRAEFDSLLTSTFIFVKTKLPFNGQNMNVRTH